MLKCSCKKDFGWCLLVILLGPYNTSVDSILLFFSPQKHTIVIDVPLHYYCYVSPNYILTPTTLIGHEIPPQHVLGVKAHGLVKGFVRLRNLQAQSVK